MTRIITVSSGKGGVGKTTFAVNFALTLSRVASTVLIDLDTGTSSVRNTIDVPVERDLYHFFRRGEDLASCLTTLGPDLDPDALFSGFAFVAGPKHAMDELTNLSESWRWRLFNAINHVPAEFIVLDLRAGLDANVIDFLPLSNSGILVFTPHHPAATLAAADIVKSLLFRKLRLVFAEDSPFFNQVGDRSQSRRVNRLLDRVEDVYEEELPNLDSFLRSLFQEMGDNPYLRTIAGVVRSFGVYFVLNMFDGVDDSYETAVKPFVEYLTSHVSSSLRLTNLGWVVADPEIHRANCERRPILLHEPVETSPPPADPVLREIEAIQLAIRGIESPRPRGRKKTARDVIREFDAVSPIDRQLEILKEMYRVDGALQIRNNFGYISQRALHAARTLPAEFFGQPRLSTPLEMFDRLFSTR